MEESTKCAGCGRPLVEHKTDDDGRPACPDDSGTFIDSADLVDDRVEPHPGR